MNTVRALLVTVAALLSSHGASADEPVAPGLADDSLAQAADAELRDLASSLDAERQHALRGIYVAIDPSRTDVLAMPACDDDGDYVVVLSHATLELVEYVAYADASDHLRGTHLIDAYGALLAREQRSDARPLPPPPADATHEALSSVSLDAAVEALAADLLAWLVADEVAHAAQGSVVCPHPTITREHGDDVWTIEERATALAWAPSRMTDVRAADAWATAQVARRGRSRAVALAWLEVMEPLEAAARSRYTYLALHPGTAARIAAITVPAGRAESSRGGGGMR